MTGKGGHCPPRRLILMPMRSIPRSGRGRTMTRVERSSLRPRVTDYPRVGGIPPPETGKTPAEENARRPVSRVLSAPDPDREVRSKRGTTIPLGRALPRASRDQPGWRDGNVPELSGRAGDGSATPIRSCSRWGLPCRRRYRRRGALLPHRFTRARRASPRGRSLGLPFGGRFVFCGTVPGVAPAGR